MTYLDIRYIKNANPTWFRGNLGPLKELMADIKKHDVVEPVLLRPDFYLIDGARRVAAAEKLGYETVPIRTVNGWSDIMQYFRPAKPDCYPMNWLTLLEFWATVLKPMHQNYRFAASVKTRKHYENGAPRAPGKPNYSGFLIDLAELYGVQPATIKLLRDYFQKLSRIEHQFPVFVKGVYDLLPEGEAARNLNASRVLKAVLETMVHGGCTQDQAVEMFRQRLEDVAADVERPRVPRAQVRINAHAPVTTAKQLNNLLTHLGEVAFQVQEFQNFEFTDAEDGSAYVAQLNGALTEFMGLRKRLQAAMAQAQPTQE